MGTTITISVVKADNESTIEINDGIEEAFSEFDRIVNKFTRFHPDSELSNLNRNAGSPTKVSDELYSLISHMLDLAQTTEGAYDPTIIDFLEIYGYDSNYDFSKLNNPELDTFIQERVRNRPSWKDIEIIDDSKSINLQKTQRIDLGGIGKGYAIDQAFNILDKFNNFVIDAGGDIKVKGKNEQEKPWQIGLKHKDGTEEIIIAGLNIEGGALASSGSWVKKLKQFHHLINPHSGKPVEDISTVYVLASEAILADGWATSIFIGGENLLSKLPPGIEAMFIDNQGMIIGTPLFRSLFSSPQS